MSIKELLGEDLFEQVNEKINDDDKLFLASENKNGEYIPKNKFDEKNKEISDLKEQRDHYKEMANDYKEKLDDFSKLADENEELQQEISAVQEEKLKIEEKFQAQLKEKDLQNQLDLILVDEKARNPRAVKALLDMDKIKEAENKKEEIKRQTEEIKKTDDYLFGETGLKGEEHNPGDGPIDDDIKNNPWERGKFNLNKQAEILSDNPSKAKSLIEKAGLNPGDYGLH